MSKRKMAKVFRTAAKLIEDHGWVQGSFGDKSEGFCAMGALVAARDEINLPVCYASLRDVFAKTIKDHTPILWNDTAGRTKKEVLRALRGTARALEHGMQVDK